MPLVKPLLMGLKWHSKKPGEASGTCPQTLMHKEKWWLTAFQQLSGRLYWPSQGGAAEHYQQRTGDHWLPLGRLKGTEERTKNKKGKTVMEREIEKKKTEGWAWGRARSPPRGIAGSADFYTQQRDNSDHHQMLRKGRDGDVYAMCPYHQQH